MSNSILFIDGENFFFKIERVLRRMRVDLDTYDPSHVRYDKLLEVALGDYHPTRSIVYVARLHMHEDDKEKSEELIASQATLHRSLTAQGLEVKFAGNVRAQRVRKDRTTTTIFREKGVDVCIAVDLVAYSADHVMDTAILCSSDSDLQPAIQEAHQRNVKVIYLGFETQPNKGLTHTTDETILISNDAVLEACGIERKPAREERRRPSRRVTSEGQRSQPPRRARTRKQAPGRQGVSRRADSVSSARKRFG